MVTVLTTNDSPLLICAAFSLLFEVADNSFKVADRAIRDTRWSGGRFVTRGSVTEK